MLVVGIGGSRVPQRQQVLCAPVALQRLDQGLAAGFDPPVGQSGQPRRVPLPLQDGVGNGQTGHPGQIRDGMVEMDVHLAVRLLHVQHAARRILDQGVAMAQHRAQHTHLVGGAERAAQQSHRVQVAQPFAVDDVGLPTGYRVHVTRVDQHHLEAMRLQNLMHRDPVHAGRLHRHRGYLALLEPVGQGMQVGGERGKVPDRVRVRSGLTAAYTSVLPRSKPAASGCITFGCAVRLPLPLRLRRAMKSSASD